MMAAVQQRDSEDRNAIFLGCHRIKFLHLICGSFYYEI